MKINLLFELNIIFAGHADKLVEEKVERILALVEERRGEVERRVREESGNNAAQQAKPQENAKPASPSPAASTSTTSSSGGGSNNAGWEQKRPYAPASSSQVHSPALNSPRVRHAAVHWRSLGRICND
jgi:hypothetical protein